MNALLALARAIDKVNETIGRAVSWLVLGLVLVQLLVVLLRYMYGIGSIKLQESILYMHGTLFLAGAAFTLLHNGHVRIDIIYRAAGKQLKAAIDLLGSIFLLLPAMTLVAWASFPYVRNAWMILEGSKETSGIQAVYLLKSLLLVFAVTMLLQGVSLAIHALAALIGYEAPSDEKMKAEI
jgi:TRAP-type mannitol/chloroaromatic compound transport system permease small subunit